MPSGAARRAARAGAHRRALMQREARHLDVVRVGGERRGPRARVPEAHLPAQVAGDERAAAAAVQEPGGEAVEVAVRLQADDVRAVLRRDRHEGVEALAAVVEADRAVGGASGEHGLREAAAHFAERGDVVVGALQAREKPLRAPLAREIPHVHDRRGRGAAARQQLAEALRPERDHATRRADRADGQQLLDGREGCDEAGRRVRDRVPAERGAIGRGRGGNRARIEEEMNSTAGKAQGWLGGGQGQPGARAAAALSGHSGAAARRGESWSTAAEAAQPTHAPQPRKRTAMRAETRQARDKDTQRARRARRRGSAPAQPSPANMSGGAPVAPHADDAIVRTDE